MREQEILEALRKNEPFRGLPGVRISNLVSQPSGPFDAGFDATFDLQFGESKVKVYAEIKNACTPKLIEQIAPWLTKIKSMQEDTALVLVCPAFSAQAQAICLDRGVDFIDLAGNVSINVPGKLLLQRLGLRGTTQAKLPFYRNPFLGKASRVLRVLLQKPAEWTPTKVAKELALETSRIQFSAENFEISLALISRVLRSLEEDLLLVRRGSASVVREPRRVLMRWAQEYKERYRWYLRRSFKCPNPFGPNLQPVIRGFEGLVAPRSYAITGAAAATTTAPFVDADVIDIFVNDETSVIAIRSLMSKTGVGPDLRVIYPYDIGVFMYSDVRNGVPVVSDIQAYLDLFARGGRDLKQADYLLETRIEPLWGKL